MRTPATSRTVVYGLASFLALFVMNIPSALALPSFALREKVSCTMCHTNGSAPHLTKYGYLYRRAGFRLPDNIGNKEDDDKHMKLTEHLTAGVNTTYEYSNFTAKGTTGATITANGINVPEVEVWPAVGAFLGNFAVWSEIDAEPSAGVSLGQADLRYVRGDKDMFFNFRGGLLAPEGFGASDQWADDGNIPAMDLFSNFYNQDTFAAPFGAMNNPQYGFEFGFNYFDTHVTLGIYNGYTQLTGLPFGPRGPGDLAGGTGFPKDYKVQVDQFIGDMGAVTAGYYTGQEQLDAVAGPPAALPAWTNAYNMWRLYLTAFAIPSKLDILAGGAADTNQFLDSTGASNIPVGSFTSLGGFVGAFIYPMPHLTLSARVDYKGFTNSVSPAGMPVPGGQVLGYSLQANLPFENNIFVFAFNNLSSDANVAAFADPYLATGAGSVQTVRAEWRFLF